ncbi:MAG: NAD-dependent epimerase/dehydratase family protein, partial [Aggregatilineales bacterium]
SNRILITGGSSYVGLNLATALLAEGAEVTLLIRPGTEKRLGPLAARTRWYPADVWNPASLRGRARGHGTVIHTVGSMVADPAKGYTHHQLNFVSARNVASMCVGDGVQRMMLMSAIRAPAVKRGYLREKRNAEKHIRRMGLELIAIRAPLTYTRGAPRPLFFRFMTLLGSVPPISYLGFRRTAPMPMDMLARGVARIALDVEKSPSVVYAPALRRLNKREEVRGRVAGGQSDTNDRIATPFEALEDDSQFGWTPDT